MLGILEFAIVTKDRPSKLLEEQLRHLDKPP